MCSLKLKRKLVTMFLTAYHLAQEKTQINKTSKMKSCNKLPRLIHRVGTVMEIVVLPASHSKCFSYQLQQLPNRKQWYRPLLVLIKTRHKKRFWANPQFLPKEAMYWVITKLSTRFQVYHQFKARLWDNLYKMLKMKHLSIIPPKVQ